MALTSLLAGILLLGISSVLAKTAQAEPLPNGVPGNWALILNEEFSANGLNTALWTPEWWQGAMNGQCTSPSLVSQPGNGYLYLQVRAQESTCGGAKHADTGALVESDPADGKPGHSGFLYSYGYVEWHVYIVGWGGEANGCPKGGCIPDWPALWSFPENEENEIDTMEGLRGKACHTWHHHVTPIEETQGCQSGTSYAGWHTYGVDWEPGVLKFYYDGAQVGEVKNGYINAAAQYLIMNDVPPGTYGGELVAPDEIAVDYVRVWQHPVAPSATTGTATSVQPLQATLNGTVNPNGFDTHYYFQYGTTTSYGSAVPAEPGMDLGSGSGGIPCYNIIGTLPGTSYHYRLVSSNAGGTTYGSDQAFTTPGPVEAVTSAATGITEEQAVLNGTVNSRGYDAKYYFQYGETTSYGLVTSEGDAGAGTSPVPENAIPTRLSAGTTYHYRLVATSGGVTSYGADRTFTMSSAPSLVVDKQGQRWYAVQGANHSMVMYWENVKGEPAGPKEIAKANMAYSTPALAIDKEGQRWYAVEGPNHSLVMYWENVKGEVAGPKEIAKAGTTYSTPAFVIDSQGQRWYTFEGANNSLQMYWENVRAELAGPRELAKASSTYSAPALAIDEKGQRWYAIVGANNSLVMYWENVEGDVAGPRELGKAGTAW
ncbi:MAG TPA: family 16 glycosylhydrolase [Solirubrobacteraceae bacterium]|nr:family 16 glycosylhydrolase [Solirubrobacteraceae bacterium]